MGLLDNIRASAEEQRVIGGVPWRPWENPFWRFDTGGPAHPTRQFFGPQDAMGLPALYAGVKLLADNAASLPLRVYQSIDGGGGYGVSKHRLYGGPTIFDKPSVIGTFFDWMAQAMVSVLLQGNAWGYITGKDGYGFPTGIEWVPPEDVYVLEAQDSGPLIRSRPACSSTAAKSSGTARIPRSSTSAASRCPAGSRLSRRCGHSP